MTRVLRATFAVRKQLDAENLRRLIQGFYTHSKEEREAMEAFVPEDDVRNCDLMLKELCLKLCSFSECLVVLYNHL